MGRISVTGNPYAPAWAETPGFANSKLGQSTFIEGVSTSATVDTTGVVYLVRINAPVAITVSNISAVQMANATSLSAAFVGLYDSDGTRLGQSADLTTTWNSGGGGALRTHALAAATPVSGGQGRFVWVARLSVGTTGPTWRANGGDGGSTGAMNLGYTAAQTRIGHILTGQTTLPASITPANILTNAPNDSMVTWWALT